jgi:hypothetical protein
MRYEISSINFAPMLILLVKVVLGGSTRIPKVQELLKDYFGKEPSRGINRMKLLPTVLPFKVPFWLASKTKPILSLCLTSTPLLSVSK